MYYVYVLKSCLNGRFYTGMTQNLDNRIKEHNSDRVKSTKHFIPYEKVYHEIQNDRRSARMREKYLKSAAGKRFLTKFALSIPAP
ncbi:MAG: GIY-YIG nuclease family protein [Bacteroidota bacterium]